LNVATMMVSTSVNVEPSLNTNDAGARSIVVTRDARSGQSTPASPRTRGKGWKSGIALYFTRRSSKAVRGKPDTTVQRRAQSVSIQTGQTLRRGYLEEHRPTTVPRNTRCSLTRYGSDQLDYHAFDSRITFRVPPMPLLRGHDQCS
jgi:hypothetical protein